MANSLSVTSDYRNVLPAGRLFYDLVCGLGKLFSQCCIQCMNGIDTIIFSTTDCTDLLLQRGFNRLTVRCDHLDLAPLIGNFYQYCIDGIAARP